MTCFIGLKPKSYCYKVYGEDEEHKGSKGIVKHKVANELNYHKYEETLNGDLEDKVEFNTTRSKTIKHIALIKLSFLCPIFAIKDISITLLKVCRMDII